MMFKNLSIAIGSALCALATPAFAEPRIQVGEFGHDGDIVLYQEMFRSTLEQQAMVKELGVWSRSGIQHLRRKTRGIDYSCRDQFVPLTDPNGSAIRVGTPQPEGSPVLLDKTALVASLKCLDNGCFTYAASLEPWELPDFNDEERPDPDDEDFPDPDIIDQLDAVSGFCQTSAASPVASPCLCHVTANGLEETPLEDQPALCASVPLTVIEIRLDQWLKPLYLP